MTFSNRGAHSSNNPTTLPSLPPPNDPRFLEALKETVEQMQGLRGDSLDQVVTRRDLEDSTVAKEIVESGISGGASIAPALSGASLGGGGAIVTVPPPVQSLRADGAFDFVLLSWSKVNYSNHAFSEVARSEFDDVSRSVIVGMQPASLHSDAAGNSFDGYYWVRHVSTSGVRGPWSPSVRATTPEAPEWILENLTGSITDSPLWERLQSDLGVESLSSLWSVKVATTLDGQTVVGGIGLSANGPESSSPGTVDFGVMADKFWVAAPGVDYSEADQLIPFVIQGGKVWINEAGIREASIQALQVEDAFLDNMTVNKGSIGEANINIANIFNALVQNYIQSDNYAAGNSGWRINRDGSAEFNELNLRARLQSISGNAYIDFGSSAGSEGEFVLGDVDSGNYISFKPEQALGGQRILRIRGDVLLKNYSPGDYFLHENEDERLVIATKYLEPLDPIGGLPSQEQLQEMPTIKATAVTREGVLRVAYDAYCEEYRLSTSNTRDGDAYVFLCLKKVGGEILLIETNIERPGYEWYTSSGIDVAVSPGDEIVLKAGYRRALILGAPPGLYPPPKARAKKLILTIGFYPEETSLL